MNTLVNGSGINPLSNDLSNSTASLKQTTPVVPHSAKEAPEVVLSQDVLDKLENASSAQLALDAILKQQLEKEFLNPIAIAPEQLTLVSGYDPKAEELAINFVTSNYQQGLKRGENTDGLIKILDDSAKNVRTAYSNTSDILTALGQFGPEQKSFISKSEHRVERALTSFSEDIYRRDNEKSDGKLFELSVQTQEGDTVTIKFSSAQGYEKNTGNTLGSFQLAYEVDGELSEQEYQALQTIFSNVGEFADDYFSQKNSQSYNILGGSSNDDFSLDLLAGFNTEQLAGVDLSVGTQAGKDQLDYSYAFDAKNQQQTVNIDWMKLGHPGLSFDIKMSTLGGADEAQLAQYLEVIDKNSEQMISGLSQNKNEAMVVSAELYKTALTGLFSLANDYTRLKEEGDKSFTNGSQLVAKMTNELINHDERYQPMDTSRENIFSEGMSTLADFNSHFVFGEEGHKGYVDLAQQQQTTFTKGQGFSGVEQIKRYDLHALSGYAESGSKAVETSEQYKLKSVINDTNLVALDQEHKFDKKEQTSANIGGGITNVNKIVTESIDTSSLRFIEEIWTQRTSHQKEVETESKTFYGEELKYHSKKSSVENSQTSTIIANMDKLANDKFIREKYLPELFKVNRFMLTI